MSKSNYQQAVKLQGIFLSFKNKHIFNNFNFIVSKGEKIVVFGKSGMGKSTLLNLLLGFVKPQKGVVRVFNQVVNQDSIWQLREKIAFVDQDVVMGSGLVREVIDEYFAFKNNTQPTTKELIAMLSSLELSAEILDKQIDQLSGGERQRLALVVALLLHRPLMLLDEVTSALDPHLKKLIIDRLVNDHKLTLIVVTHDLVWQEQEEVKVFDFRKKVWVQ